MSQLINYIQKELDKGFSKELIREKLLRAGYTKQEIQESFASLKAAEPLLRRKFPDTIHTDVHVRWSKWVFPLLAIALALFFGYLLFLYIEGKPAVEEVSACEEFSDAQERDTCYLELAAGGEDVCEKIASSALQSLCTQKIWTASDCSYDFILGKNTSACLFNKALETKDTTYCYMQKEHTDCLYSLAVAAQESSFCGIDGACLFEYALEQNDVRACAAIQDIFQWQCYDAYAEKTGDTSICDKGSFRCGFPVNGTEEEKKAFIDAKISTLSTTVMEGEDYSERDQYMYSSAKKFQDAVFCLYIINEKLQQECIGAYGTT